jgi:hypothetical protein
MVTEFIHTNPIRDHKPDVMKHVTSNTKNANVLCCSGQYLIMHTATSNSLKHVFQRISKLHRAECYKMSTGNRQPHVQKKCYSFKIPKQGETGFQLKLIEKEEPIVFFVTELG